MLLKDVYHVDWSFHYKESFTQTTQLESNPSGGRRPSPVLGNPEGCTRCGGIRRQNHRFEPRHSGDFPSPFGAGLPAAKVKSSLGKWSTVAAGMHEAAAFRIIDASLSKPALPKAGNFGVERYVSVRIWT